MTQESLAIAPRSRGWIDHAFLWTLSSLSVVAIAATLSGAGRWPPDAARGPGSAHTPAPAQRTRSAPARAATPLIAFADPEPGYPVISPFGLRQLPWEGAGRLHKGVDIAAPSGEPVLAAADGVVLRTGVDAGYGRFVEISHAAGMSSLYGHLSAFEARPGAEVKAGQAIGRIGSTGSSTGSHLHFEIHDPAGRALNPEMFIGRRFMTRADLPLKAATRTPRGVRVAYVSNIPPAKQALLDARQDARAMALEGQMQARRATMILVLPQGRIALITVARPAAAVRPAAAGASPLQMVQAGSDGRVHGKVLPAG